MEKFLVHHQHKPETKDFILGTTGVLLVYERRETIYPGWIWCTDEHGNHAWVPEAYVSVVGETCVLTRDYDSRELEVEVGEMVQVLETESGWAWVLNDEGRNGWVPLDCLILSEEESDIN
jgi:hypothetical protein